MGINEFGPCRKCFGLAELRGGLCPECHATACIPKEPSPDYRALLVEAVGLLREWNAKKGGCTSGGIWEPPCGKCLGCRTNALLARSDVKGLGPTITESEGKNGK